jgi:hypothetical protein
MERMEKQLTAVNWLVEEINKLTGLTIQMDEPIIEQAKEMEKQIMLEFADDYGTYLLKGGTMSAGTYNETYKSE